MPLRSRKQLPLYGKIKKTIDFQRLIKFINDNNYTDYTKFIDLNEEVNPLINKDTKSIFFGKEDHEIVRGSELYKQLYLTELNKEIVDTSNLEIKKSSKTIFSRVKRTIENNERYVAAADERNFTVKNEHVFGIFAEIIESFKSPVARARLAVLMPKYEIKPHIDHDPSYLTRYHIPIITNNDVIFGMRIKENITEYKMPADGSVYFFNTGVVHWVKNLGSEPRLHLIIDTHGQDDLVF